MATTDSPTGCSREFCFAPDVACLFGRSVESCVDWNSEKPTDKAAVPESTVPWSGLAMGTTDLNAIAAVGRVRVIAVVGLPNAGKTTALATYFAALRRGHRARVGGFAGSFTLLGWHAISRHLAWVPHGSGGFPPHTTSATDRVPSLLHLAFKAAGHSTRDVLLTDVPGEWFRSWSINAGSVPGATWIEERADAAMLIADGERLSGTERGVAFSNFEALARRLANAAIPTVPILHKSDSAIPAGITTRLNQLTQELFGCEPSQTTILGDLAPSVIRAVDDVVDLAMQPRAGRPPTSERVSNDGFMNFRSAALL